VFDHPDWDLPDALRPDVQVEEEAQEDQPDEEEEPEGDPALALADDERREEPEPVGQPRRPKPTADLLGWLPAVRLTNEQRQTLKIVVWVRNSPPYFQDLC
jgi:hypothetical protein